MKSLKTTYLYIACLLILGISISACDSFQQETASLQGHGEAVEDEVEKGEHGGRMLRDDGFALELSIFETGVPPEFRVWATQDGKPLKPEDVDLQIKLTRLGGKVDQIGFKPQGDALRGDTVIYEPHSFIVTITATYNGKTHGWEYDNFEGRTKIEKAIADALEIGTEIAAPVTMHKTITAYGQIRANTDLMRKVSARFDGLLKSVSPSLGDRVEKGQKLATVESNQSLNLYTIKAPISGIVTHRDANPGEQTGGRQLFTIMDTSSVWAELAVFPADLAKVRVGAPVTINTSADEIVSAKLAHINVMAEADQSVKVRVILDNKDGKLIPGNFVSATIKVAEHAAALAVKRSGLQAFRDFTVVYAKIGDEYEVRMLDLGLQSGEWAEVLGGLEPGTRYVSENSYIIKADIEKSGASHDH